jgi:peptidoglycan/LPS O-acetylase OafA/YrhL
MKTATTATPLDDPTVGATRRQPEIRGRLPHVPALDGLRGVAVIAVLLGHSGFKWARGGFLGVTAFFVLSGFLITGLLLAEWDRRGTIGLKHFWGRRARRLAPAIPVLLLIVVGYLAFGTHKPAPGVLGDALASLTWVANWRFVLTHRTYAALFADPSPFQHMWSLAVEEQFYLVLPILTIALLRWRRAAGRRWLAAVAIVGIAASTGAAIVLHPSGGGAGRAYYGTDARMAEPLVGVLLAVLLVGPAGRRVLSQLGRRLLDGLAVASAVGLVLLVYRLTERSDSLYRGGFLAAALCTAAILAAATQPDSVVGRALSTPPLVAVGRVSYGIYLFHWPIFLWLTPRGTGLAPVPLLLVRTGATLAVAMVSYALIEAPVRWGRVAGRLAAVGWFDASVGLLAGLVLVTMPAVAPSARKVTTTAAATTATTSPTQAAAAAAAARANAGGKGAKPAAAASQPKQQLSSSTKAAPANQGQGAAAVLGTGENTTPDKPPTVSPGPDGKMPLKVVVVGDSMGLNLSTGLKHWAQSQGDVVVYNLSTPGCPLSAGGGKRRMSDGSEWGVRSYCDWWTDANTDRSKYFTQYDPDLVVVDDGMNEVPDRKTIAWSSYRGPGEPSHDDWLLNQYSQMINTFTSQGAKLLFLNAACADWVTMGGPFIYYADNSDGANRIAALNRTTTASATNGVQIGDLNAHLCPNGQFTQTVDGVKNARPDGFHLSDPAAYAVADKWLGALVRQAAGQTVLAPQG